MNKLVIITPSATKELKRISDEESKEPRVRLAMSGGGCSGYKIDMCFIKQPPDDEFDQIFTQDEIEFIVDKKSAIFLKGATLDFGGGLLDRAFNWEFPDAKSSCGCGISFGF